MKTGRVTTALPVVGWSGRGPAVSLTLYHHMVSPWGLPVSFMLGDANMDGSVNGGDISAFVDIAMNATPRGDRGTGVSANTDTAACKISVSNPTPMP